MATHYTCDFCGHDTGHNGRHHVGIHFFDDGHVDRSKLPPPFDRDLCGRCSAVTRRFLNGKARVIHIDAFRRAIEHVRDLGAGNVPIESVLRILDEALERFQLDLIQDENVG